MKVKTAIDKDLKKVVVYEVPCGECNSLYIGETGRNLKERLKEHRYAVKKVNLNNGVATHVCRHKHNVDWDSAKVRCTEPNLWKRKVLEVIHIQQLPTPPTWTVSYSSIQLGSLSSRDSTEKINQVGICHPFFISLHHFSSSSFFCFLLFY